MIHLWLIVQVKLRKKISVEERQVRSIQPQIYCGSSTNMPHKCTVAPWISLLFCTTTNIFSLHLYSHFIVGESGVLVVVATKFVFPFALDPTETDKIMKNINGENFFFILRLNGNFVFWQNKLFLGLTFALTWRRCDWNISLRFFGNWNYTQIDKMTK